MLDPFSPQARHGVAASKIYYMYIDMIMICPIKMSFTDDEEPVTLYVNLCGSDTASPQISEKEFATFLSSKGVSATVVKFLGRSK